MVLILLSGVFTTDEASAQKKSKKVKNTKKAPLTKADLREAEYYFTEGEKYFILEDFAKSLLLFQKSLEINPENATVYFKLAQVLVKSGDLEKALINAKKSVALDGQNKYFHLLLTNIHTEKGDFESASKAYEVMISKIEGTEEYLFELAALYLYQENYDEALSAYDRAEARFGVNDQVSLQKQKIYLKLNKLDDAIVEGEKLIASFPGEEQYVLSLAEMLIANKRRKDAIPYLEELLVIDPENGKAQLFLAEIFSEEGENEKSMENLKKGFANEKLDVNIKIQMLAKYVAQMSLARQAGKLDEKKEDVAVLLGQLLTDTHPDAAAAHAVYGDILLTVQKKDKAITQYLKSVGIDESNFSTWQNLLQLEIEQNRMKDVIQHADQALEIFPNQNVLYYYSGAANLQKKKFSDAIIALEQGKKLASSDLAMISVFNSLLGDAYHATKQFVKSDKAYDAALDFDPNNYVVLNNYSYYLSLRKEKLELAEKMAGKVVKNNPENPTYLDTYAWVLYTKGNYKEAKKIMEKALDAQETSATLYEHYGDILYKLGDVEGAVKQWQVAKGMDASLELIDKKIADKKLYE